jgi:hypothetical protein
MKKAFAAVFTVLILSAISGCTPPDFPDVPEVNYDFSAPVTTKPNIFNTETNPLFSSVEGYTKMYEYPETNVSWEDLYVIPGSEADTTRSRYTDLEVTEEEIEIILEDDFEYEAESSVTTYATQPPPDLSDDPDAILPDD